MSVSVFVCVGLFQVLLFGFIWSLLVGISGFVVVVVDTSAVCVCGVVA